MGSGRPKGSRNHGRVIEEKEPVVTCVELGEGTLAKVFTCSNKDFIGVKDLEELSGLSYATCTELIRRIKKFSDIFGVSGYIHRTDYYAFLKHFFVKDDEGEEEFRGVI